MILWINGAFGSGKTSVAEELHKIINKSFVYDPEQVGYFLWDSFPDEMKRKGNFQHMQIWREFNYKILKHISECYDGIIIVPMTIYIKQYFDEIIQSLVDDGISVEHFILSAARQTIVDRLRRRGSDEYSWEFQHIEKCLSAFDSDICETKIDTDNKNISEVVLEITAKLKSLALPLKT